MYCTVSPWPCFSQPSSGEDWGGGEEDGGGERRGEVKRLIGGEGRGDMIEKIE